MVISSKLEHINFLRTILAEIEKVNNENQVKFLFLLIGQAIEILGSYFDNKPFRAKQQSSKRFEIAIYKLFPNEYQKINNKNFLYYQLRNFLTHSFIPSDKLLLKANSTQSSIKHLCYDNEILIIYADIFYKDFSTAVEKLIKMVENDKIKLKKISGSDVEK